VRRKSEKMGSRDEEKLKDCVKEGLPLTWGFSLAFLILYFVLLELGNLA
jgi:hypothetical protein